MNERGLAAPVALMILLVLVSLMLAFAALSQTEPAIAANLMLRHQSQGMADSGVEQALWALSTGAIADPMAGSTAPAPYDGNSFLLLGGLGALSGLFHDVRAGDNAFGGQPGYPAKPGYDLATGWGTPNFGLLGTILADPSN